MEGGAALGRLTWRAGTVVEGYPETPRVRTLTIAAPEWPGHRPGQHVDVRLTAQDGYQAVRSYSLAAPASDGAVTVTVERLDDGEVSPYLVDEARPGDRLELRGPVGGYFVWEPAMGGPLLLVGGGSGVVPLAAMLRARAAGSRDVPARLLHSARSREEALFADELDRLARDDPQLDVTHTFTREAPPGWTGFRRRVDRAMLAEVAWAPAQRPLAFVCGPTAFVETVAATLTELGYDGDRVRTERFGPTGG
jgi:ferredoxin-NADP reductase